MVPGLSVGFAAGDIFQSLSKTSAMPEIIIDSVDHDTAKKNVVVTWKRKDEDYLQFLVVPLKDWNRQVEFESRSHPVAITSRIAAARFFLMQLDVIPMDEAYLSPADHTPVPQYE